LTILSAQTYAISEGTLPAGWIQVGFRCVDGQLNPAAVVISSGQTLVCYFVNFFGTLSTFVQIYGNVTNGTFGNITLDEYIPPRTFSPTPVPPPTASCPASLPSVFTACQNSDFAEGASCSANCVTAVDTYQAEAASSTVAAQDACLGTYNTDHGQPFSTFTMNVISGRVTATPQQPLCTNAKPIPASACHVSGSLLLLTLLYLFQ
jgi:hypothetical protein